MALVVLMWTAGIVLGWALVYLPQMPDGFGFQPGTEPTGEPHLLDSVYVSIVLLATLGLGDVAPAEGWLRIVAPLEALVGFLLLSAVVSWVLGIYPALARRKSLAVRLALLRDRYRDGGELDGDQGARLLEELSRDLIEARVDLSQYPETYYFFDRAQPSQGGTLDATLADVLGFAVGLAREGRAASRSDVRFAAGLLEGALAEFAVTVDRGFLHTGRDWPEVLRAYAAEHRSAAPRPTGDG